MRVWHAGMRRYVRTCTCSTLHGAAMAAGGYVEIPREEALKLPASEYTHAAHGMLYAKWPGNFIGKYDYKYAVMVSGESYNFSSLKLPLYWGPCSLSVAGTF